MFSISMQHSVLITVVAHLIQQEGYYHRSNVHIAVSMQCLRKYRKDLLRYNMCLQLSAINKGLTHKLV